MSGLQEKFGLTNQLPYGVPDFANLSDEDYRDGLIEAMAAQRAALDELAAQTAPPDASLLADWERSGVFLNRVGQTFWTVKSADTNERLEQIEAEMMPKLAAHTDAIYLDRALYDRFAALDARARAGEVELDAQDSWLLSEILRTFRRAGITLDEASQARLREINAELASLSAADSALTVRGRAAAALHVTDEAKLAGLSEEQLVAAKAAASARGLDGWLLELVNTTQQPMLASLEDRETRKALYLASISRNREGENDARPIIIRTAQLRAEKAKLLGYETFAEYVADNGCAKHTAAVMPLLIQLGHAAVAKADQEAAALQEVLRAVEPDATLEPWDWQWAAQRLRASALQLDDATLRPYFAFETVLEQGVFAAATALYGITFTPRTDIKGYTADSRVYEVHDADGSPLALVIFDPYARPTKQGGAWMTDLVPQNHLLGDRPVVTNNCNQPRPADGKPSLMTWDEVTTLFHEFGHDLHAIVSDVRYPSRSGTNTPTDFVEYPSQVNEIWAWDPALIQRYARHYETGEPLPQRYIDALVGARQFGTGYASLEVYQAQLLDQAWHQARPEELPATPEDVDAFERAALERYGVYHPLVAPRYRSCYFSHIWQTGYEANYYAYTWSEVMDADTAAWFEANGGLTRENGERFRRLVLGRGGCMDVMAAYREFRGADPDPVHLIRRRGLQ